MIRPLGLLLILAVFLPPGVVAQVPSAPDLDQVFAPVKWRSIGPFRGGRSVASVGVIGDPMTYYMGTTGGGLWKTRNMGITWQNISDGHFKSATVGAIAVAPSDPNVIYVGMGEHAIRGVMTHSGDGVYRSTDAGKTWTHVGLAATRHTSRIIVHPGNPDIVWVAAQGALYGPNPERGVYKSTDGGATWRQVLKVDERTGAAELSLDATNPRILYAAMWEHGRLPWQVKSGGPGSGLYKSTDGGETWSRMAGGLPDKMGKMAIAVSPVNPERVYALIESDSYESDRGLWTSTDAGETWRQVTDEPRLVQRAWYYIELFLDPKDEETIYVLSAPALKSTDGGKSWTTLSGTHGDYHDLWINPDNPRNFVISNDGGAAITFDGGDSWSSQATMPTAQIYRINVDNRFPYRIYGGQQDNSSVIIASRELGGFGITTDSWAASAGGESAFLAFDPDNPRFVLGGSYQGSIEVLDTQAEAGISIMAAPIQYLGKSAEQMRYRFNWNAPIIWSRHQPGTFYHGAQLLLRTSDHGRTWTEASPDLTRNEKAKQGTPGVPYTNEAVGAENYGTLAYVAESPHEPGVIWTGSDDGLVHVTRDGGTTWTNVTPPGLAECLVNAIEISPHAPGTVYLATTRYKFEDLAPGLWKTTDYGATWTRIDRGIPYGAFTRVVREDDVRRDLLYAGTESGVFISWNGGRDWAPFQLNLPITPITDLRVHRDNLIASTSGRSFWILDDLPLIRQYQPGQTGAALYRPASAVIVNGGSELNSSGDRVTGTNPTHGVNPANGVVIYYRLPKLADSTPVTLEIADAQGNPVRSFSSARSEARSWAGGPPGDPALPASEGMNRFVWDMRYPTMPGVPGVYIEANYRGHKAVPGTYRLTLRNGETALTTDAVILANPLYSTTAAEYARYHDVMQGLEQAIVDMHGMVNTLTEKRTQLSGLLKELPKGDRYAGVRRTADSLATRLKTWDDEMVQRRAKAYDDVENFPNRFSADYLFLVGETGNDLARVNQSSLELRDEMNVQWNALKARGDRMLNQDLPALNRMLWDLGLGAIWLPGQPPRPLQP